MKFYSFDLDFDPMTLVFKHAIDFIKVYVCVLKIKFLDTLILSEIRLVLMCTSNISLQVGCCYAGCVGFWRRHGIYFKVDKLFGRLYLVHHVA